MYSEVSFGEGFGDRAAQDRPYTVINAVTSLDGKASVGGRSGNIGGETDRLAMRNLRSGVDALMIGAGTLRAEKLSMGVPDHLAKRRASRGKPEQPLAVILSKSGDVPFENLVGPSPQNTLVFVPEETAQHGIENLPARVCASPSREDGTLDLIQILAMLKEEYAVSFLLIEGGPSLNHSLLDQNLADELFLTISPKILGGSRQDYLTVVEGDLLRNHPAHNAGPPTSIHLSEGHLFLRYAVQASRVPPESP